MTDTDDRCPNCAEGTNIHPTENVCGIPIDELLAPLIRICWRLGIHTTECCQEFDPSHGGARVGYICFSDPRDATAFLTVLAAANPAYAEDFLELNDFPSEHNFSVAGAGRDGRDRPGAGTAAETGRQPH